MDKKNLYTLADRLQFLINERGYSHNDVARLCGIKQGSVSYILAKNLRKSKLANEMADGLNVSYEWLTKGEGPMTIEKAYAIPFFTNVFDALKFYKQQFQGDVHAYRYTANKAWSMHTLALELGEGLMCICGFGEKHQEKAIGYLDVKDILDKGVVLRSQANSPNDFAVLTLNIHHPTAPTQSVLNALNKAISPT